jgi:hypothetical protein
MSCHCEPKAKHPLKGLCQEKKSFLGTSLHFFARQFLTT